MSVVTSRLSPAADAARQRLLGDVAVQDQRLDLADISTVHSSTEALISWL